MTKSTLHHLRIVTPGIIFLVLTFLLLYRYVSLKDLTDVLVVIIPASVVLTYPIGMLYRTINVRKWFLGDFWVSTKQNISSRLMGIIESERQLSTEEREFLQDERRLMDIFYIVVDTDETLTARTQGVYSNGYIVTTLVDIGIISAIFAVVNFIAFLITKFDLYHFYSVFVLFILFVLSAIVIRKKAEKNHKDLSDEQLRVIESFHSEQVLRLADKSLRRLRQVE